MTYHKPEIATLASSISTIQMVDKPSASVIDNAHTPPDQSAFTANAYEADE